MRHFVRSAIAAVAALTACASDPVGRHYPAEKELISAFGNCAVLGRFDVAFPARVERVEHGTDGIRFEHRGTPHEYDGIDGPVHAVFVEHRRGRGVLVLRDS